MKADARRDIPRIVEAACNAMWADYCDGWKLFKMVVDDNGRVVLTAQGCAFPTHLIRAEATFGKCRSPSSNVRTAVGLVKKLARLARMINGVEDES